MTAPSRSVSSPPLVSPTPTPRSTPLLVVLGVLSTFGPLTTGPVPARPAGGRRRARGLESQVQLTLTACLIGLALGQAIAGPVSDTLGRRRPLFVGLALFVIASLGCAVAPFDPRARRAAARAGAVRRGGHRARACDRARPLVGPGGGPDLRCAHDGPVARADPRADDRRRAAAHHRLAGPVRRPRRLGRRAARRRRGMGPRDAAAVGAPPRRTGPDAARHATAPARPGLHRLHGRGGPVLRRAVLLHRRIVVRLPGHLRRLAAGLRAALRPQRRRAARSEHRQPPPAGERRSREAPARRDAGPCSSAVRWSSSRW